MSDVFRRGRGFLLLALLASGCGGGYAAVQGTVTLDGAPVDTGYLTFVPTDAALGPSGRASIANGRYAMDASGQLKPGAYRVEIYAQRKTGKKIRAGSPAPPGTMIDEEVEAIPAKYNTQTTLTREAKAGGNTFDFDLSSTGK